MRSFYNESASVLYNDSKKKRDDSKKRGLGRIDGNLISFVLVKNFFAVNNQGNHRWLHLFFSLFYKSILSWTGKNGKRESHEGRRQKEGMKQTQGITSVMFGVLKIPQ